MPERRDPSARESKEEEIAAVNTAVATLHGVEVGSGEYSVEDVLAWHDNDADEMRAAVARVRKRLRAVYREDTVKRHHTGLDQCDGATHGRNHPVQQHRGYRCAVRVRATEERH